MDVLPANTKEVSVFDDVDYVEGSWAQSQHELYATEGNLLSNSALSVVKLGAKASDSYLKGFTTYPQWHGFGSKKNGNVTKYYSNYMGSYIYITELALAFPNDYKNTSQSMPSKPSYLSTDDYKNIIPYVSSSSLAGKSWSTVLSGKTVHNRNKRLFMYGMALHTVTDLFAHSTYRMDGTYINHASGADKINIYPNRDKCAEAIALILIKHIKSFTKGDISDFYTVVNNAYDKTFLIPNYAGKAEKLDSAYYYNNYEAFNKISGIPIP